MNKDCVNVSVRIRPSLSQNNENASCLQILSKEPPVLLVPDRTQTYHFDNIFTEDADQQKVYDDAVKPFVDYVKKGYNCTVFAYGQTGTGKTYTMGTGLQTSANLGIIPQTLEELFNEDIDNDREIEIFISFSEIYNEKVFDLLQSDRKIPLPLSGFIVQGLSTKKVDNVAEARELLQLGNNNRHKGETKQNQNSSRSHAIFTVYFILRNSHQEITGKLNLVDLAGSESVRKTGSKGSTFQEGININKGLLSLGQVISALSLKSSYVPYRQSVITSILQGSLNTDNYISLIACISSNPDDTTETLQTLDFAQRAKRVRNNPEVNQIIAQFKRNNPGTFGSGRTPIKRPTLTPLKASALKKIALPQLPLINESTQSQADHSRSQSSMNFSSVSSITSSNTDISRQALSPVIRKYITKMEVSIMDKLEEVIKNTLKRPTRASLLTQQQQLEETNKENTPGLSWNRIQNEVSKLVKNEIALMSAQTVRATSSPINDKEKERARRVLHYDDSPEIAQTTSRENVNIDNFPFKVPVLPVVQKRANKPAQLSISPIENNTSNLFPRRSTRLSLKMTQKKENSILNISDLTFNDQSYSLGDTLLDATSKEPENRRRSVRVAMKKQQDSKTPKNVVARAMSRQKNKDSPYTAHSKKVLRVLNEGTVKEVEKLHSIGPKTAEQIFLFRELKGGFQDIDDMTKMPGWGAKKYEKFVALNFLRKQ